MDIIDVLSDIGYSPKKKSAKEYCSPCPYCQDGDDRFVISPDKGKGGRFWCRFCDKRGDAINLLRDFQGLNYIQACERLRLDPGQKVAIRREEKPLIADNPPSVWMEKAAAFVEWCHAHLLQSETFLSALTKRGLTLETIKAFKLGYNPTKLYRGRKDWGLDEEVGSNGKPRRIWLPAGITIPTFEGDKLVKVKIRNRDFEKDLKNYEMAKAAGRVTKYASSKYVVVSGSKKCPSVYGNPSRSVLLVQESELDCILTIQEAGDLCFCLALGGSSQPLDLHKERIVRGAENLLFCPDFDQAGKESWDRWIKRFPDTIRILPEYGKDVTESFQCETNIREWLLSAITKKIKI